MKFVFSKRLNQKRQMSSCLIVGCNFYLESSRLTRIRDAGDKLRKVLLLVDSHCLISLKEAIGGSYRKVFLDLGDFKVTKFSNCSLRF